MLRIGDGTNLVLMSDTYCDFTQICKLLILDTVLKLLPGPTISRKYFCWVGIFILLISLLS